MHGQMLMVELYDHNLGKENRVGIWVTSLGRRSVDEPL